MNLSLRFFRSTPILPGFSLSFGFSTLYISLVILLPISALLVYVSGMSWDQYWFAITDARVLQSYKVTALGAFYSTVIVTFIGFLLAWIITRYEFPGRRLIDSLVDLPFALPTSVAGITLSSYSAKVISVIEAQPSKVILVGHSMGGMVISEVSEKIPSKIVKLVYLAAFLPKSQQSLLEISSADKQTLLPAALEFSADQTTVSVKKDNLVAIFCQDGSETIKQILLDKNRTEPLLPLTQKVTLTDANFGSVPKFYIRTVNDKAIGITLQDQMITTTPVKKVYSLNAGHTAHLSHANEVSKIIEEISATK